MLSSIYPLLSLPEMHFDMKYPAFTDMHGLVDRGDVVLAGSLFALSLQSAYPDLNSISHDQKQNLIDLEFSIRASEGQKVVSSKKLIQMLVYIHCWFHGAVEDRRKVVAWLKKRNVIPNKSNLRTFVLCSIAYGIASAHRQLGMVCLIKLDLIVANIMV